MCFNGTHKYVDVINPNQIRNRVVVDACIAEEIQKLNNQGVITLGCCCGHGLAGKITEWENMYGKWKGYHDPPNVLIAKESVKLARKLNYTPYPYYYADGENEGVWQMHLRTGCITIDDCKEWKANGSITKYRVYDERTNETLYTNEDKLMCANFIFETYDESGENFEYMCIGKVETENRYGNRIEAGDRISDAARDGITDDTKAVQKEAAKNENKST